MRDKDDRLIRIFRIANILIFIVAISGPIWVLSGRRDVHVILIRHLLNPPLSPFTGLPAVGQGLDPDWKVQTRNGEVCSFSFHEKVGKIRGPSRHALVPYFAEADFYGGDELAKKLELKWLCSAQVCDSPQFLSVGEKRWEVSCDDPL